MKPEARPDPAHLRSFSAEPGPNLRVRSGLSGRPDPLRTLISLYQLIICIHTKTRKQDAASQEVILNKLKF